MKQEFFLKPESYVPVLKTSDWPLLLKVILIFYIFIVTFNFEEVVCIDTFYSVVLLLICDLIQLTTTYNTNSLL